MKEPTPGCQSGEHPRGGRQQPTLSEPALRRAAGLFRAMGDEARLRLLALLASGDEWCVTEIKEAAGENFSTISQRLRILRDAGLVVRRRKGTHVFYALADRHVVDLIQNALAHADELETGPREGAGKIGNHRKKTEKEIEDE